MTTQTSRLSSKGQVTIPKQFREVLGLQSGDVVAYEVRDGTLALRKIEPFDAAFHKALGGTLAEWSSPEDEEAFSGL